ncbi:MAG: hypothetical protein Q9212_002778 [Teloschistes hypoglaucus]
MARPSMAPQRNLTLTEELEKLEQSITLTLQEIDHNFSRAHRIVTTGILPVVEKYAEHSGDIWESSKFWKQFFEASANVSLSGYEEPPEQGDDTVTGESATITTPSTSSYASPSQSQDGTMTPQTDNRPQHHPAADDSIMSTTPPEQSTPRQPRPKHQHSQPPPPSMALYSSPYEALKREIKGQSNPHNDNDNDNSTLPSTPRNPFQSQPDEEYTPSVRPSTAHRSHRTPKDDPLLHRILDKNWRLQATPHTATVAPKPGSTIKLPYRSARRRTPRNQDAETPAAADRKGKAPSAMDNNNNDDDDLDSSPALPAPQLHSEIFGTPAARGRKTVPGVSVLTPARKIGGKQAAGDIHTRGVWDSDSDDDGEDGEGGMMSPPKTIQFHIPQSKLLRTPAREASKKIVEDLLHTAGGGDVTDEYEEESSPSVVKRVQMEEDDTF